MVVGDLVLNEDNYTACRAGQDLLLTPTEFRLLRLLMRNSPRVVLRSEILNEVWSEEMRGRANVDTYVSYWRKKIDGARARENQMLVTKRGFGYKIIPAL
jgi:DNA-binding response OmpR family regulator